MAAVTEHQHYVLIIEDDDDGRESLALVLELEGCRVVAVSGGLAGLVLMRTLSLRPCVIVADLVMPEMDGLAFRQRQLEYRDLAAIPIVAVTGHETMRRRALTEGFAAALLKPSSVEAILSAIEGACGHAARQPAHKGRRAIAGGRH